MILAVGTTPTIQRTMVFEALAFNEINRAVQTIDQASGKSVNVARVLHVLGNDVLSCGFAGGDTGQFLLHDLDARGVKHDYVMVSVPTRTCVTVVDRGAGTATELIQESHAVESSDFDALLEKVRGHIAKAEMLVMSGSLPPDGRDDFYAECCKLANEHNVRTILDARSQPLIKALPHKPFVVKPNRMELQQTVELVLDSESAIGRGIAELVDMGAQWVVVTMGANGALVGNGKLCWRISVPRMEAINTIGSGDACTAGIVSGILSGQTVEESCRLGAACGVANTLSLTAGTVELDDVKKLLNEIALEPLK